MGTDIHPFIEVKTPTGWKIAGKAPDDRNYWAFAVLAGVRNGNGFAGCDMGNPVPPIAEPRGIPADSPTSAAYLDGVLGDHSFSWVTLKELLNLDMGAPVTHRGMVKKEQAEAITAGEKPDSWCGWTNMAGYVHATWTSTLRESAPLLQKIIDEMKWSLPDADGDPERIRLVFGFDS